MAVTQEPLLRSPGRGTHAAWKLAFFISLIAVLSLAAVVTHQIAATRNQAPLQRPAELCSASPNQATCLQIISGGAASEHVNPCHVLRRLLGRSAREVASAAVAAAEIGRRAGEPRERAAMADCLELLDLSAVRVQQSASSALTGSEEDDARTWISASLTNYGTCLDGLPESAMRSEMEALLRPLMETASAYLAVLNAVSRSPVAAEEATAADFPSWLSARDRKLLTATSAGGIVADAVVAKDGSGRFLTVQEAVDAAPEKSQSRYVIYVKKGIYKENVSVGKRKINLMIVGDGADATVISGSLNVVDGSTTFNSATLAAVGDGFILQDLCVENTAGPEKHQAVALRVGADKSVINRCKIEGYQDTLYTHSLRQFFRDSTISGTVDFIFGNAAVVIQNCELVARRAMAGQKNAVTAQGRTDPNQNTGTSIQRCRVVASGDLANANGTIPTFLGRPWKEYSRTVYMQSYIGDHIAAAGWLEWSGSFALNTLFYGEYKNEGPGARTESRVKWEGYHRITDPAVARAFTVAELIQGGSWLPSTGIPFTEGL